MLRIKEYVTSADVDLDVLWLAVLQEVVGRAAHEVKDALNGVTLNLEVIRSRTGTPGASQDSLNSFATSATDQLERLTTRTESMLFLTRTHRIASGPADVALTLRHLAALLIPATKSDGGTLEVDGYQRSVPTSAPAQATRLALAAGLLLLIKEGGSSRCRLEPGTESVVRFSHESAGAGRLDPAIAAAVAVHNIRVRSAGSDLVVVFPGNE